MAQPSRVSLITPFQRESPSNFNMLSLLNSQCKKDRIQIHISAKPFTRPHIGKITTFATAFALAAKLRTQYLRKASVKFVWVDNALDSRRWKNTQDFQYHDTRNGARAIEENGPEYCQILERLSSLSGVPYEIGTQEFWQSKEAFVPTVLYISKRRATFGPLLCPETGKLGFRGACPNESCSLADIDARHYSFELENLLNCRCKYHGAHRILFTEKDSLKRLSFSTPLGNLIRSLICGNDETTSWISCTGAENARFYQEQLLWRTLEKRWPAPLVLYAPTILDMTGARLSLRLCGADDPLDVQEEARYMVEVDRLLRVPGGMKAVYDEVASWVTLPFQLFRDYCAWFLHDRLKGRGLCMVE